MNFSLQFKNNCAANWFYPNPNLVLYDEKVRLNEVFQNIKDHKGNKQAYFRV